MSSNSVIDCEEAHRETRENLVIIIFERSLIVAFKNAVVTEKAVIHNYGHGVFCGAADSVEAKEGHWIKKKTVGCLKFDSDEEAVRWFHSDRIMKQPDWLDSQLHSIPLTRPLPCGYPVVCLMEVCIHDKETFFGEYKPAHQKMVEEYGGKSRIAGTWHPKKLRGGRDMNFTILDLFKSMDDFDKWYDSDDYKNIKCIRQNSATGGVIVFELSTSI